MVTSIDTPVTEEQLCELGKQVENLLSDPRNWTQRRMMDTLPSGKRAYCLVAGIRQCTTGTPYGIETPLARAYVDEIERTVGVRSVMRFNDSPSTTHSMVIDAIKKTNARVCTTTKRAPWWRRFFRFFRRGA